MQLADQLPDKQLTRRSFEHAARSYDAAAVLQQEVAQRLLERLDLMKLEPARVLDLGCGTGLGAQLYRPFAKRLTGVDVSSKMLEKAQEKKIYDSLKDFDILQDWLFPQKFDLIYSSDVFVYFGNLDRIIVSISMHLVCG